MATFATSSSSWDEKDQGQIFNSSLHWPNGGVVTSRNWHINVTDASKGRRMERYKVLFRHGTVSGEWVLIINGTAIRKGFENVVSTRKFVVTFPLVSEFVNGCASAAAVSAAKVATITVDGSQNVVKSIYTLRVDGIEGNFPEMRDMNETQVPSSSSAAAALSGASTDAGDDGAGAVVNKSVGLAVGEVAALPLSVTVTDTRSIQDDGRAGVPVFLYQLWVQTSTGQQTLVERRFSQFDLLDSAVRSSVRPHIASTLPTLPSKVAPPWVDQQGEEFIAARKTALEVYMNALLGNYKIVASTDLLCFLGLNPVTGVPLEPLSAATAALLSYTKNAVANTQS